MTVTSHEVARAAGVSQPTVSRALSGDPKVADETRTRVIETAQRLGYFPNTAARSLITSRTFTVGVVIEDVINPFYAQLLNPLYYEFLAKGYRVALLQESEKRRVEEDLMPLLIGGALDGVVFTSVTADSCPSAILEERGYPMVMLNRYVEGVEADQVRVDNYEGARLAAHYLAELGHERIGVIGGPEYTSTGRDRDRGFRDGLQNFDLQPVAELRRTGLYSFENGYRSCLEILQHEHPPTAIFCANDVIALGALNAAKKTGVEVPNELSIIGFDDLDLSRWEITQLSTIHQPISEMAGVAACMLVERIEGAYTEAPRKEILPVSLVERSTTAPPHGS